MNRAHKFITSPQMGEGARKKERNAHVHRQITRRLAHKGRGAHPSDIKHNSKTKAESLLNDDNYDILKVTHSEKTLISSHITCM